MSGMFRKPAVRFWVENVEYQLGYSQFFKHRNDPASFVIHTPTAVLNPIVVDNKTTVTFAVGQSDRISVKNTSPFKLSSVQIRDINAPECTLPLPLEAGQTRDASVPSASSDKVNADSFTWSMVHYAMNYWTSE